MQKWPALHFKSSGVRLCDADEQPRGVIPQSFYVITQRDSANKKAAKPG